MDENLRGEMSGIQPKVKYPSINLNWILNASKDESNEVQNSSYFFSLKYIFLFKGIYSISSIIITLGNCNMCTNR